MRSLFVVLVPLRILLALHAVADHAKHAFPCSMPWPYPSLLPCISELGTRTSVSTSTILLVRNLRRTEMVRLRVAGKHCTICTVPSCLLSSDGRCGDLAPRRRNTLRRRGMNRRQMGLVGRQGAQATLLPHHIMNDGWLEGRGRKEGGLSWRKRHGAALLPTGHRRGRRAVYKHRVLLLCAWRRAAAHVLRTAKLCVRLAASFLLRCNEPVGWRVGFFLSVAGVCCAACWCGRAVLGALLYPYHPLRRAFPLSFAW